MKQVFEAEMNGRKIDSCVVDRVKYRPGRNCTVSYVLSLYDEKLGGCFDQYVAARFFSNGESVRRYAKAVARDTVQSAAGPTIQHIPALDMVAHWCPNDAKIVALSLLHDEIRFRFLCLDEVVRVLTLGLGHLIDYSMQLVQYVPELRFCARVIVHLKAEPGAALTSQTLYVKTDSDRDGAKTHALMQALSESPAQLQGRLRTPKSVLWQATTGLHWQLSEPGQVLTDLDARVGSKVSAQVGAHLAALHAVSAIGARKMPVGALLSRLREVAQLLGEANVGWVPLLSRLVATLESSATTLEREPTVLLHGDLHPRNILIDGSRLTFIDLDSVCFGPVVIELGAWVGDAFYRTILDGGSPKKSAPAWRAFLAAYANASSRATDEPLLAWGTAYHLLCHRAYRCIANMKPGRFEAVPDLLALADLIASAGTLNAALSWDSQVSTGTALLQPAAHRSTKPARMGALS
jgi:hypothetical protein